MLFDKNLEQVVLIEKQKPEHHKGLWNGVGGKIEADETSLQCMVREFKEEAGYYFDRWKPFCKLTDGINFEIDFYWGIGDVDKCYTAENQAVMPFNISILENIMTVCNIPWLVQMALSHIKGTDWGTYLIYENTETGTFK